MKRTEKKLDWWTGAEAMGSSREGVGCEGLGGQAQVLERAAREDSAALGCGL